MSNRMNDPWERVAILSEEYQHLQDFETDQRIEYLGRTVLALIDYLLPQARARHLEAQQETPASASQPTDQPAPSSSEASTTASAILPTWITSYKWSSRVKAGGNLRSYLGPAILDWLNSQPTHGNDQEVEIGVTLTSRASTPPSGSASPSTVEPTREASGHAGDDNIFGPDGVLDEVLNIVGRSKWTEGSNPDGR